MSSDLGAVGSALAFVAAAGDVLRAAAGAVADALRAASVSYAYRLELAAAQRRGPVLSLREPPNALGE